MAKPAEHPTRVTGADEARVPAGRDSEDATVVARDRGAVGVIDPPEPGDPDDLVDTPDPGDSSGPVDRSEVEDSSAAADGIEATADKRRGLARRSVLAVRARWIPIVAVLLVAGSLAFASYEFWQHRELDSADALRGQYIDTARTGVVALTTISSASAEADVKRLANLSSGSFKTDFTSRSGSYTQIVKEAQVASKGTIIAVGVEKMSDTSATMLVAAHAEVTNEGTKTPEPRDYRFRVVVSNGDPMTIAKVDFVP